MDSFTVDRTQTRVEAAALRTIAAHHYFQDEDPHADAQAEHASEQLALAARDLVRAVEALPADKRPIGWDVAEVAP